eukprot:6849569-Karenia_brevis.AAC.1
MCARIPKWSKFAVKPYGIYLGIELGPGAGDQHWVNQSTKWAERACSIASLGLGSALAWKSYSSKSFSALGYVMQFFPPKP